MKLAIEKAIYGGAGLARSEGKAVFVPMALPGETVEVALRRDKGSFAEADLVSVLKPSAERVAPPCPFYGACGGCQYQHASYPAQLRMKHDILVETLTRAGLRELPPVTTHAGEPWGYRNRIRLHVDPFTHSLGYRRRGSRALLPVDQCRIAAPLLEQALLALRTAFESQQAGAWCAEVELFSNGTDADADETTLLLSFRQKAGATLSRLEAERKLAAACESVQQSIPALRGAALFRAVETPPSRDPRRATRGKRSGADTPADEPEGESAAGVRIAAWGAQELVYRVGERTYRVSVGAFFQGNRFLAPELLALATVSAPAAQGAIAWDLFAGVGLFAQQLAQAFSAVVAVEGAPISVGNLRQNLPGQRVIESSTLAFLRQQATQGKGKADTAQPPALVVLDPPRAGLGAEASALLASLRSPHITYVSCDPATLARDLRVLVDAGYTLSQLHLMDMFPQTLHLETVAVLQLR